jgi:phage baseplate assembly protein W
MTKEFLGVGWSFPVQPPPPDPPDRAAILLAHHEDSVRQSVWLILNTSPGERVMRPTFGCGLHESVFSVGGETTAGTIADAVRLALTAWEPRLDLLDVDVTSEGQPAGTLLIQISYVVRATNNVFNLVYPFYLDQVEG